MYLNKAMVYGNLTRDPELKALPNGNRQEQADYHNVVVFGRQAETSAQYLKKGSPAFVEGRLQTRSWDKDGVKQYRTEIVADRVQFGPRGGASTQGGETDSGANDSSKDSAPDYPEEEINPEDIPF